MRGCSKFNLFPALGYLVKKYLTKELGDKKRSLPSNSLRVSVLTLRAHPDVPRAQFCILENHHKFG